MFFDTVGVVPLRGRLLGPADDMPGCPAPSVVVVARTKVKLPLPGTRGVTL